MRQHSTVIRFDTADSTRLASPQMPKPAVAAAPPDNELNAQLNNLGRQIGYGRGLRPGRAQIVLLGLLILAFWLLLVFGRALAQLNDAETREAAAARDAQALQVQLDAGRRELQLVQTDGFQRLQARALGMGESGEQVFALAGGAPEPAPIVPLGRVSAAQTPISPLEAWLHLLFGD